MMDTYVIDIKLHIDYRPFEDIPDMSSEEHMITAATVTLAERGQRGWWTRHRDLTPDERAAFAALCAQIATRITREENDGR